MGGHGLGSGLDWMRGWSRSMGWGESLVRPTGQRQYCFGIRFAVLWGPQVGGSTVWIKHAVFGGPTELGSEFWIQHLESGYTKQCVERLANLAHFAVPPLGPESGPRSASNRSTQTV